MDNPYLRAILYRVEHTGILEWALVNSDGTFSQFTSHGGRVYLRWYGDGVPMHGPESHLPVPVREADESAIRTYLAESFGCRIVRRDAPGLSDRMQAALNPSWRAWRDGHLVAE
jgi:hypothetical protein